MTIETISYSVFSARADLEQKVSRGTIKKVERLVLEGRTEELLTRFQSYDMMRPSFKQN